jgi:hypothetical protein
MKVLVVEKIKIKSIMMKYNGLIVVEKIFFNVYMYKRKRHVAGDFDNKDKVQREKQEEEEV